jgi:hypothetical protein
MLIKLLSKTDWIFAGVASVAIAVAYVYKTNGKHGFFFAWSAAFFGIMVGLLVYSGVKQRVMKR